MDKLIKALKENSAEVNRLIAAKPDWKLAHSRFDTLFAAMSNPADKIWSKEHFTAFSKAYFSQRENDGGMGNIVTRTIPALPEKIKNHAKIMLLQVAEACCLFNASHKVNFDAQELPDFTGIAMTPGKGKGVFTYAAPTPAIYKKTSLTFDYWVPKFIEWTEEIRTKGLKDWKGTHILQHESATDFMRACLLFLSGTSSHPPIAKAEERQAFMSLLGKEFVWIKKSAKREDIIGNNARLLEGLAALNKQAGINIPPEAWIRLQQAPFIKPLIK